MAKEGVNKMRIALMTHLFAPSIGGIETMSYLLARAFISRGHEVHVVTSTSSNSLEDDQDLTVIRCPNPRALAREVSWCDVCFHNNISLSFSWPLLFSTRPWVVTTQTWIEHADGKLGWREYLKRILLRRSHSVAISNSISDSLPVSSLIIPNCYDTETFHEAANSGGSPTRDLVFTGRLVSAKGADIALDALAILATNNLHPNLTIVGDGPERKALEKQVSKHKLDEQVRFTGPLQGAALAHEFQQHRIQLVPSRWAEPFGIVALEGAACGCFVIGSAEGGLTDAIGPCGTTFPNGDAHTLAKKIAEALSVETPLKNESVCRSHLERHSIEAVADTYLSLFQQVTSAA